eukprot:499857_1
MTSLHNWIILPSSGIRIHYLNPVNQLLKINDLEFGKYDSELKCIQKYNTVGNKWTKWKQIDDFNVGEFVAVGLNQHKLYIYTDEKLVVINTTQ